MEEATPTLRRGMVHHIEFDMKRYIGEYNRHSIRLPDYDYSQAGFYFVTVCAKDRECLFGEIECRRMKLNELGRFIKEEWLNIARRYDQILLDKFVVMPNHIHGIIHNVGATLAVAPNASNVQAGTGAGARPSECDRAGTSPARTARLGDIIGSFKSLCVYNWLKVVKGDPLNRAANIWHRNYYERIIRSANELAKIRKYIQENPAKWQSDENNPINIKK